MFWIAIGLCLLAVLAVIGQVLSLCFPMSPSHDDREEQRAAVWTVTSLSRLYEEGWRPWPPGATAEEQTIYTNIMMTGKLVLYSSSGETMDLTQADLER
jgi:hypothetical protein